MAPQLHPVRWAFGPNRPIVRSFFSRIGKSYLIFPAAFLVSTAIGSSNLALIFYARMSFGFSPATIGWFAAVYSIFYFAGCLLLRPVARRLLPRYSLIIATASMATVMLLLITISNPTIAFVLYALYGLSASLFWPPIMGWLSSGLEGESLGRTISRFNLSWGTGAVISPYIAGALAEIHNRVPIYLAVVLLYSAAILVVAASLYWARIRGDRYIEPAPQQDADARDESTPLRFPAWVGLATTYIAIGVLLNIFPVFARDHTGLSKGEIGFVLLVRALVSTAVFVFLGRTSFWHYKRSVIFSGQIALALAVISMLLMKRLEGFLIGSVLFGIVLAFNYDASIFHGVSGTARRARRMSVHESTSTAGTVVGSIMGGWLYQTVSMHFVWLSCIGVAVVGMTIQGILFRSSGGAHRRMGGGGRKLLIRA